LGKELITRFSTSLHTNQLWWTDSQGQEMQQRQFNFRPTWKLQVHEPAAGNYYPMNVAAFIKDTEQNLQFTLLTDRSRGCGSLADGQIETMLQRRLLADDGRGVGEPLNETETIRTLEWLIVDSPEMSSRQQRRLQFALNNPPTLAFANAVSSSDWIANYTTTFAPLTQQLPPNIHMLTLKTLEDGLVLLRLHHVFGVNEDHDYSKPVTLQLDQIFTNLTLISATEMSLTANQPQSEVNRLKWKTSSTEMVADTKEKSHNKKGSFTVKIKPMEIKTYVMRLQNQ